MGIEVITTIVLLFLMLLGTLFLETQLKTHFQFEVIVLIIGIIGGVILLIGEASRKKWVWPFSSIFHSLALGNLALLFVWTQNYIVSLVTLFITLIGLLRSFAKIDEQEWEAQMDADDPVQLDTYDSNNTVYANSPDYANPVMHADAVIAPKRKSTRKRVRKTRKSTRKKAAKRSARKTTRRKKSRR